MVSKAEGDLNRDAKADVAFVLWPDEAMSRSEHRSDPDLPSYRLLVGFMQPNGGFRLIVDNGSLLDPPDPFGVNDDPLEADAVRIVHGKLDISRNFLRGHYRYRFRWSGRLMRLIGYDFVGSDGRCISDISINFLTRNAAIETEAIGEKGVVRRFARKITRSPVSIEEASADGYYPLRDMAGPLTYCILDGQRV